MKQQTETIANNSTPVEEEPEPTRTLSLFEACKEGELALVQKILQDDFDDSTVHDIDEDDWTPLHHAIHGGNVNVVKYLVDEQNADLETITTTMEGQEALHFATSEGHLDVIKYLAENGGEEMMDSQNDSQLRPLHLASLDCHLDIVQYLAEEHNVDVEAVDDDNWTAMHYASLAGDLRIVQYLAEELGVDCDGVEVDGWTPLHCAANKGHTEVVKYLLEEQNVDMDSVVDNVEQNALHLAASEGRCDTVKYLVDKYDFDPDETSSDGDSAFQLAARYGMLDVVKYFVERLGDTQERFDLLFSENDSDRNAYEIAVNRVESENEYANEDLVDYLYSYVAPLAVPGMDDAICVKLNPALSDTDLLLTQECYNTLYESEVHEVAHVILGYLCLSDIKRD